MEYFQDHNVLHIPDDFEYKDSRGEAFQGQRDQEEAMDYDNNILEEEESVQPTDSEEQNLFGLGEGTIFEQDVPASTPQPSQYGLSQLIADLSVPTQEKDPDVPPHSQATELALQLIKLDWNKEVDAEAPSDPVSEEEVVEVGRYPDPCLLSLPREPIPQDLRCSKQRFEQDQSN